MKKMIIVLSVFSVFYGCSTAKVRVLPGESSNRVVVRDYEKDGAEEAAAKAASDYCAKKGQELQYIGDNTKYQGSMDEDTRNIVRKGSEAAMLLGGVGGVAGRETATPGALIGSAGTVGYVMTSNRDYEATMEFKCR